MKDINFAGLKTLVERQLTEFDGGIMDPGMVPSVPLRQPAADPPKNKEYTDADKMYDIAFKAREATEELVEALDDPAYDDAFEYAFRASACLRRALNTIIDSGARPTPEKRVVAPRKALQKYFGKNQGGSQFLPATYSGGDLEEGLGGASDALAALEADLGPKIKSFIATHPEEKDALGAWLTAHLGTE